MMNILKYFYHMYYRPKIFFPKKTYSMIGEDLFVDWFFKKKKIGFYVDVGCYHPLQLSNTYLLYKRGWSGINIDPNQTSIDLFNFARKRDINKKLAITNKKTKIKFYSRSKINMLNTVSKKMAKAVFLKGFQEKIVNANTLNSVLNDSPYKERKIDFLNIDAEGNEINVLKSLSFKKYKPNLICIEIHNQKKLYNINYNYLKTNQIYKFLIKKKYKKIWSKEFSFIFKRV